MLAFIYIIILHAVMTSKDLIAILIADVDLIRNDLGEMQAFKQGSDLIRWVYSKISLMLISLFLVPSTLAYAKSPGGDIPKLFWSEQRCVKTVFFKWSPMESFWSAIGHQVYHKQMEIMAEWAGRRCAAIARPGCLALYQLTWPTDPGAGVSSQKKWYERVLHL